MRIGRWGALALAGALLVAGCGDDDESTDAAAASGASASGDVEAYCDLSAQLDEQDGPPTAEQFAQLREVAPEEISGEINFVIDRFEEKGLDAFVDPEVGERFEVIEPWEEEHCPHKAGEEDSDDEEASPQEPAPDATKVEVVATDYDFAIEGEVPTGKVAFVMRNEGEHPHHMSIIRFKDGTTLEEAEAAVQDGLNGIQPIMDDEIGQSSDAAPGEIAVVNAELEPGVYGMACFVESDGTVHFSEGMRIAFEVG